MSGSKKYLKSNMLFHEACKLMPGGVNSPVRACKNVHAEPLFIDRGDGSHLWDVDGNEYIDYVLSWGPMLLGHAEKSVTEALEQSVLKGTSFGAPCQAEVTLAQLIIDTLPGVEMLRMVNSGTEATMSAIRLARGVTKRNYILKFIGCYHGHADPFLIEAGSGVATFGIAGTPGITPGVSQDTLLAPYNDCEAVKEIFEKFGNNIAAAIIEPVAANMGLVLPENNFLSTLSELCNKNGALLIFDEVITGFRLAYGGAQERFSITPDITTLGKIIGGGLPVGCFGGRRELMEHIAPQGEIYQAGTLSGNPLAMTAGIATLNKLKNENYEALEKRVKQFSHELEQILRNKKLSVQIPTIASMFSIFFNEKPVRNFADAKKSDANLYEKFYKHMRSNGIYLAPSPFETDMVSFAHTNRDFEITLEKAREFNP